MHRSDYLSALYCSVRDTPSDINQHAACLRRLSEQCQIVTEFGVRHGNSTVALMSGTIYGKLESLTSFDIKDVSAELNVTLLSEWYPDRFTFVQGNSTEVEIENTDLLFIDTLHQKKQLYKELTRHSERVSQRIVLHDTVLFGNHGEGSKEGLIPAVNQFLDENGKWFIEEHIPYNCGLTILAKTTTRRLE